MFHAVIPLVAVLPLPIAQKLVWLSKCCYLAVAAGIRCASGHPSPINHQFLCVIPNGPETVQVEARMHFSSALLTDQNENVVIQPGSSLFVPQNVILYPGSHNPRAVITSARV